MTRLDPDRTAAAADARTPTGQQLVAQLLAAGVEFAPNLSRGELLVAWCEHRLGRGETVHVDGVLELLPEGFGFLRAAALDFEPSPHDPFVSPSQVRALNLKPGHRVRGPVRAPRGSERHFALVHVDAVADAEPGQLPATVTFAARTPIVATRRLPPAPDDAELRALATLAPWCRGQRVLVQAPPAWSRAAWLARLAAGIHRGNPDVTCTQCLLDQQPEDLAAAKAHAATHGSGDVVGTSFDQPPERHLAVADLVMHRARRDVENGRDVVLLVDSLTALVLASQRTQPSSGRWLCPGLDAQAVLPAKRLFASARACAEGGSLTVIATAFADATSVFTSTVLAEFRDRANSEVVVDLALAAAATPFPFDVRATRTRPEDDGRDATARAAAAALRARLAAVSPAERGGVLAAADPPAC